MFFSRRQKRIQALDYTHHLSEAEMPKRILACDFRQWELTDLTTGETTAFLLTDLPKHIEKFGFILGRTLTRFKDQDPVNIKAAELVGLLHDLLRASGYTGHRLEVFLTRIVFCLFADDTGIFEPKDILWDYLETRTATDGSDLGPKLSQLFDILNTPPDERQTTLDPDLARFPYVNGHLLDEYFPPPAFNADMRAALLNACNFDWTPISPAIFGSLFQSVMDATERRKKGAHYTTEKNILKLIGPLFLDDLRAEFTRLKDRKDTHRRRELTRFQLKLRGLTFLDPACGCGNFLVITYRELRQLELEVVTELQAYRRAEGMIDWDVSSISLVDVDQFYGIELEEFPARIAETALWMMDHIMNTRLSAAFGEAYVRIPLNKSPHITHGDALELDWASVIDPAKCSYILGNPPFVGQSYQSKDQREQRRRLTNPNGKNGTPLTIAVPPGTVVRDADTGEPLADLLKAGDQVVIAVGGRGGRGNSAFASSTNQAPRISEKGEAGQTRWVTLELKLLADVGIIGIPNAGKSTLLSRVTAARPKAEV